MRTSAVVSVVLVGQLFLCVANQAQGQGLVINELMASNRTTIADEDREFPDWIELYNAGPSPIDLGAYTLSDDPALPGRWPLPSASLEPAETFLIFASGKDRSGSNGFWETVVDYGDTFRYYYGDTKPGLELAWTRPPFDDAAWYEGPSPLGYENDASGPDIASSVPFGTITLYARGTFQVADPNDVVNALLHVDYDDAFVAYLNGTEIARGNMPQELAHNQAAGENHEAVLHTGGVPERWEVSNVRDILRAGTNVLALKLHNVSNTSSDFTLIPFLTLAYQASPLNSRGTSNYLPDAFDTRPHANFKLDATAEYLILSGAGGAVVDSVGFSNLDPDVSIGRKPDGTGEWVTFLDPTPGAPNHTVGFTGAPLIAPDFSLMPGRYSGTISLTLTSPEEAPIYYTTDGSPPTASSTRYTGAIMLNRTTVVRARAISAGRLPSRTVTGTYLFNENSQIAVISLATDPPNLWDYHTGIYADGPGWTPANPHFGANFHMDWEKPVHVELFENDGTRVISQGAGVRIFGAWSRARPQKSLALFAREEYGTEGFNYRIFPGRNYDRFHSIVLRNSGNDWNQLHFIDAYMQAFVHYTGMETLEYRPAHVYLNGEYWGILNIREKANEHHAAARHALDPDSIDVLEMSGGTAVAAEGTPTAYNSLVTYLNQNDVRQDEVLEEVERRVDIDNFIDYQITQIFLGNTDWPGNNHKFWRPQREDGRFRWILYDTDFGFGSPTSYNHNTLAFATATNGPDWPNPPGSTFLLRTLLRNTAFRDRFINRFADHLNYTFSVQRQRDIMDELGSVVEPEIQRQFSRWGGSMNGWRNKRTSMLNWGQQRTPYMWQILRSYFGLPQQVAITVNSSDFRQGRVRVNRHLPEDYPFVGSYFPTVTLRLEAVPRPGYRFVEWSGSTNSTERVLHVTPQAAFNATAHFELDDSVPPPLTISEIQYHPPNIASGGDWVELHNPMPYSVDASGWLFQDEDPSHTYYIPNGTIIGPRGFLVIVDDARTFQAVYPDVTNLVDGLDFAFSNSGEWLRLYAPSGELVDEVRYSDDPPWPSAPDGGGYTLELAHITEDNARPEFWEASRVPGGTPGRLNTVHSPVSTDAAPELPTQVVMDAAYPNPFQVTTTIPFALPQPAHVQIRVFNALGQVVATILDGERASGRHEVAWVPEQASSGVYFYDLVVDGARRGSGKVVLVR